MARLLLLSQIEDALDKIARGEEKPEKSLNSFSCKKMPTGWVIRFNDRATSDYGLKVKNTGLERTFVTLEAVAKWMGARGFTDFKVIL